MNESCPMYDWVLSHIWMGHITRMSPLDGYMFLSHVTHMNESYHTCEWVVWLMHEWVILPIWTSHFTGMSSPDGYIFKNILSKRMNQLYESCHTHEESPPPNAIYSRFWYVFSMLKLTKFPPPCGGGLTFKYTSHDMKRFIECIIPHEWVMLHIRWVMSYIWMSHVTHMNESCHTYHWMHHSARSSCATPERVRKQSEFGWK